MNSEKDTERLYYVLDILSRRYQHTDLPQYRSRITLNLNFSLATQNHKLEEYELTFLDTLPNVLVQLIVDYLHLGEEFLPSLVCASIKLRNNSLAVMPILVAHYIMDDEAYVQSLFTHLFKICVASPSPTRKWRYKTHYLHQKAFTERAAFEGCFFLNPESAAQRLARLTIFYGKTLGPCIHCWCVKHCQECHENNTNDYKHKCESWKYLFEGWRSRNPHYNDVFMNNQSIDCIYCNDNLSTYCFYDQLAAMNQAGNVAVSWECLINKIQRVWWIFMNMLSRNFRVIRVSYSI